MSWWHECHDIMSRYIRSRDMCSSSCPLSPSCQYPLFKCLPLPRLPQSPLHWPAECVVNSIEIIWNDQYYITPTSSHQTDHKNHHLQCEQRARGYNKYITSERCSSFIIGFDDVMMMTFDSKTHVYSDTCLPSDPWPLCPRVAWSTCPRPPPPSTRLMSLSAPHIFAYCEMLPQWSLATPTHETGNRCQCNDNNIQEMDSRLSGLCSWFRQISRNVADKGGRLLVLPGLGLKCHWDWDQVQRDSQWRRYWGGGSRIDTRCLPGINELTLSLPITSPRLSQSEASIQLTWSLSANERPVSAPDNIFLLTPGGHHSLTRTNTKI